MSGLALRLRLARKEFRLDVDVRLPAQGVTAVFGPSGSGKTTLLRCVAGLERGHDARIVVDGETWQDDATGIFLPPHRRRLGYVFQEASLFDHLDVRGNLEFGLKRSGGAASTLAPMIELLGIGALLARRPAQLSGGERQLAAIDFARRREILPWLDRLRDELRIPMLYVTHSGDEVARLASHLVLLAAGQVRATGPLAETLARIDLPGVPGEEAGALLQGTVAERDTRWSLARVAFAGGQLWIADPGLALGQPARVRVLARDVSLALAPPQGSSIQNLLQCTVRAIAPGAHPSQALVQLACGETLLVARITGRAVDALALAPGQRVWAQVKSAALVA